MRQHRAFCRHVIVCFVVDSLAGGYWCFFSCPFVVVVVVAAVVVDVGCWLLVVVGFWLVVVGCCD